MTPQRMVELLCPSCKKAHWKLDHDFRGISGDQQVEYPQRIYQCPLCGHTGSGFSVLQASPPAFFLQPHDMYPMGVEDFNHWLEIFRTNFPDDRRLKNLGVSWYPGPESAAGPPSVNAVELASIDGPLGSLYRRITPRLWNYILMFGLAFVGLVILIVMDRLGFRGTP